MMTDPELIQACKNIGYDLTCGACAELFFTGVRLHRHDDACATVGKSDELEIIVSDLPRTPDGDINNCALANGVEEKDCQMCQERCPDRERFKAAPSLFDPLFRPAAIDDDPKNKLQCSVCGAKSTPLDGCRGTGGPCVIRRPVVR